MDYVASNCPLKGRRSRESQQLNQQSNNTAYITVTITAAENKELQQDTIDLNKANVAELQKQLQDAERDVEMTE